jgi:hypothetical protein
MKKLLFAFSIVLGSVVAVNAQDSTATNQGAGTSQSSQYSQDEMGQDSYTEKEVIAASELPASVTKQLQSQDYSSWSVGKAYRKEKDGQTYYAVEMTNGSEKKMVKFDAQGNKVKEKKKDK